MKFTWEEQDIKSGRQIDSHNRAERYIIGYDPSGESGKNIAVISLRDGMISTKDHSQESLASWLNKSNSRPVGVEMDDHKPSED